MRIKDVPFYCPACAVKILGEKARKKPASKSPKVQKRKAKTKKPGKLKTKPEPEPKPQPIPCDGIKLKISLKNQPVKPAKPSKPSKPSKIRAEERRSFVEGEFQNKYLIRELTGPTGPGICVTVQCTVNTNSVHCNVQCAPTEILVFMLVTLLKFSLLFLQTYKDYFSPTTVRYTFRIIKTVLLSYKGRAGYTYKRYSHKT